MQIQGTNQVHGPHGISAPHFTQRAQPSQSTSPSVGTDRVEISPAAEAAAEAAETGQIRHALVNMLRSQISAGTYDTPAKLDAALERMFDEIG